MNGNKGKCELLPMNWSCRVRSGIFRSTNTNRRKETLYTSSKHM